MTLALCMAAGSRIGRAAGFASSAGDSACSCVHGQVTSWIVLYPYRARRCSKRHGVRCHTPAQIARRAGPACPGGCVALTLDLDAPRPAGLAVTRTRSTRPSTRWSDEPEKGYPNRDCCSSTIVAVDAGIRNGIVCGSGKPVSRCQKWKGRRQNGTVGSCSGEKVEEREARRGSLPLPNRLGGLVRACLQALAHPRAVGTTTSYGKHEVGEDRPSIPSGPPAREVELEHLQVRLIGSATTQTLMRRLAMIAR